MKASAHAPNADREGQTKDVPSYRQPVKGFEQSNGHARVPGRLWGKCGGHQQPVREGFGDRQAH